jgi:hypothetical protein
MKYLVALLVALALVALAVVCARDMDRRGHKGELYAIAVLFFLPLGLLMWVLDARRPPPTPVGVGEEGDPSPEPD